MYKSTIVVFIFVAFIIFAFIMRHTEAGPSILTRTDTVPAQVPVSVSPMFPIGEDPSGALWDKKAWFKFWTSCFLSDDVSPTTRKAVIDYYRLGPSLIERRADDAAADTFILDQVSSESAVQEEQLARSGVKSHRRGVIEYFRRHECAAVQRFLFGQ